MPERAITAMGSVDLRYVARAGLLPELSRQTYDTLWKATREAVLNSVDARATQVDLDLSRVVSDGVLEVSDDGYGMTLREFCERFMSLGGSSRFGDDSRFGRIGIGSLALLQYGDAAVIESKTAGSSHFMRARIAHAWDLGREARQETLSDLPAGTAEELPYRGRIRDHFTRLRLEGVSDRVVEVAADPGRFYSFCDRLQRVLPLPLAGGALFDSLRASEPALVEALEAHVADWSANVAVHSTWERGIPLLRRTFGDDPAGTEQWSGPLRPLIRSVAVRDSEGRREIDVLGYLLTQKRALTSWSGVTARIQNVAVEEQSFFEVSSDPGFRKYISGEVWILGDLHRERLINIDRASFNREDPDYKVIRRFMGETIVEFKAAQVQRIQRAKVRVKKRLDEHVQSVEATRLVVASLPMTETGLLPSSEPGRRIRASAVDALGADLATLGAKVDARSPADLGKQGYVLDVSDDGTTVNASLRHDLLDPVITYGSKSYRLRLVRAGDTAAAIIVRQRPRVIVLNLDHPSHTGRAPVAKIQASVALEFAFLFGAARGAEGVYDQMLEILSGT